MKVKTVGKQSLMPSCKKCGKNKWRKKGLMPSNPLKSSKGYYKPSDSRHVPEAYARLFSKRYVCQNCGCHCNYGKAGRPMK